MSYLELTDQDLLAAQTELEMHHTFLGQWVIGLLSLLT